MLRSRRKTREVIFAPAYQKTTKPAKTITTPISVPLDVVCFSEFIAVTPVIPSALFGYPSSCEPLTSYDPAARELVEERFPQVRRVDAEKHSRRAAGTGPK